MIRSCSLTPLDCGQGFFALPFCLLPCGICSGTTAGGGLWYYDAGKGNAIMKSKAALMACAGMLAFTAAAFTTASVPSDGVYKFTFGVKSITGLVYRLARGTAVDGIDSNAANAVAEQEATSSRVSLVDDDPPAAGAFYKVTVELR